MNEININLRQEQLRNLEKYLKGIDKDITLILQSLQWERKNLKQGKKIVTCKYDSNHRIPSHNVEKHEEKCYLKSQNYIPGELFFPEPLNAEAVTIVKLSAENINDIINYAVKTDPSFKRSSQFVVPGHAPATLGGLQAAYSADERRALYDAVAAAAPSPAPLHPNVNNRSTFDPPITSGNALAALRDAHRRRAKHRRAAPGGYKHELRELIGAQMESLTGKWKDKNADIIPDVMDDELEDGRRCGRESRDKVREDSGTKFLNPNRREHIGNREDKREEFERANREEKKREYDRETREGKKGENQRQSIDDKNKKYERKIRVDKGREYHRYAKEDNRREYKYYEKSKDRKKIYEHDDRRRHRQYDKEYLEQENNYYPTDKKKEDNKRSYDCKDRKRKRDISISRDNKKYQRERLHEQKSTERVSRGQSPDNEFDRNNKRGFVSSYVKIKKTPLIK